MPGVGLLFAILIITLLGFLTANLVGRTMVAYGEGLLDRMPLVRNVYRGLRQLFQTALSQTSRSFQKVVLVEYPMKGVWRVGFVATRAKGEIRDQHPDKDLLAVFIPNTPNVTAGFLVFVPRKEAQAPRHERGGGGEDDHLRRARRAGQQRAAAADRAPPRQSRARGGGVTWAQAGTQRRRITAFRLCALVVLALSSGSALGRGCA